MPNQPKALVIDDSLTNVAFMKAALDAFEIPYDVALTGLEAVSLLSEGNYIAVLLDYHMPGMDGAEILDWINTNLNKRPFVVVVTADDGSQVRTKFGELGCDAYIVKPIAITTLFEALAPIIGKKKDDQASSKSIACN